MPDEAPSPKKPAGKPRATATKPAPPEKTPGPTPSPPATEAPKPAAEAPATRRRVKAAAKPPAATKAPAPKPSPAIPPKPAPPSDIPTNATFVDASGLVVGRAASLIAKRLLNGETVVVLNAEKSVVTGNRAMVIREFTSARAQGSVRSGPHYPRFPDRIFRRTVRGMLPHLKTRGKVALDRLHVFIGVPPALSGHTTVPLDGARSRPALRPPTTLAEISTLLGAHL